MLWDLPQYVPNQLIIRQQKFVPILIHFVKNGTVKQQRNAAGAIANLASGVRDGIRCRWHRLASGVDGVRAALCSDVPQLRYRRSAALAATCRAALCRSPPAFAGHTASARSAVGSEQLVAVL